MSRARRALAAVIMAIAACALGIPLASSTTAYDYDGTRTTSVVGGSGATETPPGQALPRRPAFGDRAPGAYDDRSHVARASARPDEYRWAPRSQPRFGPGAAHINDPAFGQLGDDIVGTGHNALRPTQDWINRAQVDDYIARLRAGEDLQDITVQRMPDGRQFILDGHHRYIASQQTGISVPIRYIDGPGPIGLPDWSKVAYQSGGG